MPALANDTANFRNLDKLESAIDEITELVERAQHTTNTCFRLCCYYTSICRCLPCRLFFYRGDRSAWYMMTTEHSKSSNEMLFG